MFWALNLYWTSPTSWRLSRDVTIIPFSNKAYKGKQNLSTDEIKLSR